ncbi:MAG: right-handed parallel beta-helix repeat-containing protein, partial [Syntrophomonas sp.]|nr:right-handed parallel beta-helix repeat-containing protein [Syntrophomonas sp.]
GYAMRNKAICMCILLFSIGLAQCSTLNVSQNSSIQLQVDSSSPGDNILVGNGTFYENIIINKSVILRSIGDTVIDGLDNGSTIILAADGVILEGLKIKNSSSEGINIISNNNTLKNNIVDDCQIGIVISDSKGNMIEANTIRNNKDCGVVLQNSSNTVLNYNYISNNAGYGLEINDGLDNLIKGNNVSHNGGDGIYIKNSKIDNISENMLLNNSNGIFLYEATESAIKSNSIENSRENGAKIYNLLNGSFNSNYLYNNLKDGTYISNSRLNMIKGNDASNNGDDGIYIEKSDNNMILANQAHNNKNVGIYLRKLGNSTIKGNKALNNTIGLAFYDSSNNSILENIVNINQRGVSLRKSLHNIISNNDIDHNKIGLYLNRSNYNLIGENTFDNNEVGLAINVSTNNTLENTTFTNNDYNVIINEHEVISLNQLWKNIIVQPNQIGMDDFKETPNMGAASPGSGGRTSNDGGSGPSISISIQSICDAYFDSLGAGKMLLNAPDKMNQSESYTVEAYVPRNYTLNLSSDPSLTGVDRWFNLSKVGEYMGLKLEGGSAFAIDPAEEVEQYIPNGQIGTWTWEVTPQSAGEQKLTLKVTTYYKHSFDEKGIPASASFHRDVEVTPKEIVVQVNETPTIKEAFNDTIAIAGGIVGLVISILTLFKLYAEVSKRKKE